MHVKCLDERVVARAKRRGIDVLVYAPHFTRLPTIRARAERFSDDELLVVPARELFTGPWSDRKHLLAIGLTDPIPDFITIEGALAECRRQEAAVLVPHPALLNVSLGRVEIEAFEDELHGVETYNGKCFPCQNRRAADIAANFEKPEFGSSYAHLRGNVGEAWTAFDRRIDTEADLTTALRGGTSRTVEHRPGLRHRLRTLAEFSHLGYENTWGKIDRLLLSGTEPTHPRQLVYEGRFDDVAVY
ncbi:metal-dependent phosphoesterase [Haloprofundus marisrubri]|uniref:Metal-dependent phosphoesterase n=1 Tax=Haloprofundus marisrubri TaxID=1514971 RepID=A0A0W1RB62_9EURY|nr:PHP-associated domain-containing protein [Haloprofundus marisrubri]KTG10474.1 metal-dependent phosphoesterase [Haloprofundus marisrubri]